MVCTAGGWLTLTPGALMAETQPLALIAEEWEDDYARPACVLCEAEFGVFLRRHHCRYCGQLFCDDCSNTSFALPQGHDAPEPYDLERVCHQCEVFLCTWWECQKPERPDDLLLDPLPPVVELKTPPRPESFEPVSVIGIGGVGKVFLARRRRVDPILRRADSIMRSAEQLLAIKTMSKEQLLEQGQQVHACDELRVLRRLADHPCPYLLPLLAAFQSPATLFLVMPFVRGGDLHATILRMPERRLEEAAVRLIAAEITLALGALHSMDIVFRDLKPGNVLIGEDGHVQLTDFGVAKENASKSAEQTTCGTPLYMSPEQVHHATMQEGGYSFTVDWWALGTLIFEALAGRPPFKARQIGNIMQKIANEEHKFPDGLELSAEARGITARLLDKDADRRLGAESTEDVQAHPWFGGLDWAALARKELPAVYIPPRDEDELACFTEEVTEQEVDGSLFAPASEVDAGAAADDATWSDYWYTQ